MTRSTLLFIALLALGCGSEGGSEGADATGDAAGLAAPIVLGEGIEIGEEIVRLGEAWEGARARLGAPDVVLDLGRFGARAIYTSRGVALGVAPGAEGPIVTSILMSTAFVGATADGLAPGLPLDDLPASLGDPRPDPFMGLLRYPDLGLTIEPDGDKISRLHLY
jgi:hypothetical protein